MKMCTQYTEPKSFPINVNKIKIKIVFSKFDMLFDDGNNDNFDH